MAKKRAKIILEISISLLLLVKWVKASTFKTFTDHKKSSCLFPDSESDEKIRLRLLVILGNWLGYHRKASDS